MIRLQFPLYAVFVVLIQFFGSSVHAIAPSVSVQPMQPAATFAPSNSRSGAYFFDYESIQLTDDVLERLRRSGELNNYVDFFDFENQRDGGNYALRQPKVHSCKVMPGDDLWPAFTTWDIFDQLLGESLIKTTPIAAPCYNSFGVHNQTACSYIAEHWTEEKLHYDDPTSIMFPIFQGRTCMPTLDQNGTCTLGGYPSYAVNVSTVAQIQLAVNFARNANIRLVIKNTGHCYLGKSSGAGALSIWLHNLKDITYLPEYKSSWYSGGVFKVGAGVQMFELYEAGRKFNVSVLGGICKTVGFAGGYIAGGGHSPLDVIYGMAADQVVAMEVVTADGRFVTAAPNDHSDLFWALRGGGGSTFGVVTSVVIKVYPKIHVTKATFGFKVSENVTQEIFWAGVRSYFANFIPFTDARTYSWFRIHRESRVLMFDMIPFFAPNHMIKSFGKLVQPWFDRLRELGIPFRPNITFHTDFYDAFHGAFDVDYVAGSALPGSRLFPRANWEDEAKFNATFAAIKNVSDLGGNIAGYHQAPGNPQGVDNAVNSAFRTCISFLITTVAVPKNATPAQMKNASDHLTYNLLGPWRAVAPTSEGGGVYLNEANSEEPNWQAEFYGAGYPKLYELKQKWDPKGVFYATTAVGSEDWEVRDGDQGVQTQNGRLCRV